MSILLLRVNREAKVGIVTSSIEQSQERLSQALQALERKVASIRQNAGSKLTERLEKQNRIIEALEDKLAQAEHKNAILLGRVSELEEQYIRATSVAKDVAQQLDGAIAEVQGMLSLKTPVPEEA